MNQTNPIVLFWALLELKSLKGKVKSETFNRIDAMVKASGSLVENVDDLVINNVIDDLYTSVSETHCLVIEAKSVLHKAKSVLHKTKSAVHSFRNISGRLKPINEDINEASSLVNRAENVLKMLKTNASETKIQARNASIAAKAICIAAKSKSYADCTFARACFSMTSSRTNHITNAMVKAFAVSVANTYANARLSYAQIKVNHLVKSSRHNHITKSLEEIAEHLTPHNYTQIHFKRRAWDIRLIANLTQGLSEVFPEDWNHWQHWISDMMESRTRMQSNGVNHSLVSLNTFYELTRFVWHIGIYKVFILATRRATR